MLRALLVLLILGNALTADAKSRDPIRFAEGVDATQKVVIAIARRALKKSGFRTELVSVPGDGLLSALSEGVVHAHPAVVSTRHTGLSDAITARAILSLGGISRNGRKEPIQKLVAPSLKKKWPYAQKLLKRMVIPSNDLAAMAARIAAGSTPEEAIDDWWKANRKRWQPWVSASKNWMKP